ncbi:hypothetical protein OPT61_g2689 [Boeremia exigua]|uniref:Uncharacterized protein n=1 Tax=Boeremia exigua TaxID=749465 RepID=A0ACC2IKK5_9PLEO|nr:hypothetical protein OPT61_g2689 [Boeremia exigua]
MLKYQHATITLGREFVSAQFRHSFCEQVGEEAIKEPEIELKSGLNLQAGQTKKISVQTYSVPVNIMQHLSIYSVQFFRQLSEKWHSFLKLLSSFRHNSAEAKRSCNALKDKPRLPKHLQTGTFSVTSAAPIYAQTNFEDVAATDAEL